jgi:hypothetical protein
MLDLKRGLLEKENDSSNVTPTVTNKVSSNDMRVLSSEKEHRSAKKTPNKELKIITDDEQVEDRDESY